MQSLGPPNPNPTTHEPSADAFPSADAVPNKTAVCDVAGMPRAWSRVRYRLPMGVRLTNASQPLSFIWFETLADGLGSIKALSWLLKGDQRCSLGRLACRSGRRQDGTV